MKILIQQTSQNVLHDLSFPSKVFKVILGLKVKVIDMNLSFQVINMKNKLTNT